MNCPFCDAPLAKGMKVVKAHRFSHMNNGRPQGEGQPIAAHLSCVEPALTFAKDPMNPYQLRVDRVGLIMPVAPSYQCLRCAEPWRRGDLLVEVYQVECIDNDAVLGHPNVRVKEEVEYAHCRCEDRDGSKKLDRARVVLG